MRFKKNKKFLIHISVFFLIIILLQVYMDNLSKFTNTPVMKKGNMDTSNWNFDKQGIVPLNGEWEFYWNRLLEPKDFANSEEQKQYINIPNEIADKSINNEKISADGYATLRIKIQIKDNSRLYGLKFQYFGSASKVWVNGNVVASSGQIGNSKKDYKPQYIPKEVLFKSDTKDIEVVVQVENYHHRRVRLNEVEFGTSDQIINNTYGNIIKESFLIGSLILIAIYYFVLYFIQKRDKAAFYLSIIAVVVAIRESIIGEKILIRLMPNFSAEIMMKLGYLPVFVLLPLLVLYISEVLKSEKLKTAAKYSKYFCVLAISVVLIFSVKVYDWIFQYGSWIIIIGAIYIITIVLINGLIKNTKGTFTMVIGSIFLLLAAVNDIFRELGIIQAPELISIGMVIFIVIQAIFLAWSYNDAFEKTTQLAEENELMFEEIQELNKGLEDKIKSRTIELEIANSRLEIISKIDPLTGLVNRREFQSQLHLEWTKSLKEKQPISALLMDIDFFKGFNDTYGHLEGDKCLLKIANTIKKSVRQEIDIVARYGGEEFVALLPYCDADKAKKIAENIRKNVKNMKIPHSLSDISNFVTISIGVNTLVVSQQDSKEDFINKADIALYAAKEEGRDRVISSISL